MCRLQAKSSQKYATNKSCIFQFYYWFAWIFSIFHDNLLNNFLQMILSSVVSNGQAFKWVPTIYPFQCICLHDMFVHLLL